MTEPDGEYYVWWQTGEFSFALRSREGPYPTLTEAIAAAQTYVRERSANYATVNTDLKMLYQIDARGEIYFEG